MCGNQTFWERRSCSIFSRCTGETPGQCHIGVHGCLDGSSENRLAKNQTGISLFAHLAIDCGDDLTCTARDGEWAKKKICVGKKFLCDNYLQCEDGKDEEDCEFYEATSNGVKLKTSIFIFICIPNHIAFSSQQPGWQSCWPSSPTSRRQFSPRSLAMALLRWQPALKNTSSKCWIRERTSRIGPTMRSP